MHRLLVLLTISSLALTQPAHAKSKAKAAASAPAGAEGAYAAAKKAYGSLKKDAKRRKYRDQWVAVAGKFESVAKRYPKSPRAPEALFNAAELYRELSRISLARRDLKQAVEAYGRLCERYPRSYLSDDAHMALGQIYRDRKGNLSKAEDEFRAAMACKGDLRSKAQESLAEIASVSKPPPAPRSSVAEKLFGRELPGAPSVAAAQTRSDDEGEEDEEEEAEAEELRPAAGSAPELDRHKLQALKEASNPQVPLSVQVGLKIKRIILDAGHGGHDAGAIGQSGLREKDVALAIARKVGANLEARGFEVLLTRDGDRFVSLENRARFANRNKGDLFVSIHCNAARNRSLRGTETYTLNVTGDRYAIRLAARENASSERTLSDLQFILADLATKANTDDSSRLARAVQSELVNARSEGKTRARNLGVKQALFYVLLGARMPSVLVETAFISNPAEEQQLADSDGQQKMADAIASGVARFAAERDSLALVDDE